MIDTSAWVEMFRSTGSRVHAATHSLHASGDRFLTCGPVAMETSAGARNDVDLRNITAAFASASTVAVQPHHYEMAATLYRMCRNEGVTVRSMIDCLIAVVTMSADAELLHLDRDFNAIAGVVPLRIHPASVG